MIKLPGILPPGLGPPAPASPEVERGALGQQQFFDLMIAQLQNQDPLEPLESNEFMGQIAQFASVNGIQEMQSSIEQLVGSLQSSQALQASTLVGRDVLVSGSTAHLAKGEAVSGAVELETAVDDLVVNIFNPAGQLVRRLELGPQEAGFVNFSWEGLNDNGGAATPGNYVIGAQVQLNGQSEAASTLIASQIESVTLNQHQPGLTLNLKGMGTVDMEDIRLLL